MLRWIWAVPAAIDSDRAYSRCSTWSIAAEQAGGVVEGQAGPAEHPHGHVAHPLAGLVVGELEHRPADAGAAVAGGPGDVALGQRPQGVELGGDHGQLAPDAGVVPRRARPRPASSGRSRPAR